MFIFFIAIIIMALLATVSGLVLLSYSNSENTTSTVREFAMALFFLSSLNLVSNGLAFGALLAANSWLGFY